LTSPSAADILQETPMNKLAQSACVLLLAAFPLFPQGRDHGRSMVISQQGIAATSQTLASQAAAQILAKGGSAADAAIAANAVLAVTEPMMTGMGATCSSFTGTPRPESSPG